MADRNIIRKELDLDTDSVLSGNDKHSIHDFFYSMSECLSTHDHVQNKSYVSLKPVNLKPFYIKPYLTHELEIRFTEAEMEKLRQMGPVSMADRNIIRKELDLDTDSVLSGHDKHSIRDFFYSMSEYLSTHDHVQNKSYVSLKPVNLKPFYIKPYLTHESEIRFTEAEMEKLRQMGPVNSCALSCSSKSHIQVQN